uniref:Intercellular adhesion molecule 2 n=1 Tax=Equus caballus TaxID=9796 RepID=A0A9L0S7C9_HORSE|nr:intercellular adhesion molecule 2 isoform X1 [Equus caballus]
MSPCGCWGLPVVLLALLCCPGSCETAFEVYVQSEVLTVESGMTWKVNCSTNCTEPEMGGLETSLTKNLLDEQAQWKQFLVSNVSQDIDLHCYFICSGEQQLKTLNIGTSYLLEQVLLKLQPTRVAVGTWFTIECRVPAVEAFESLTLILLRGKETLHRKTFEKTPGPQEAVATYQRLAHRNDSHHNFSCRAELSLHSHSREVIFRISEPRMLDVYEPMQDNQMVIIITVVSVLLFLFVTSILLCFVLGQHWRQNRRGNYGVQPQT